MLLRYFVHFYDMEIIEEEAFLAWKEDITQEFPGKGKALFQVIPFLLPDNLYCNSHHRRCTLNWLFFIRPEMYYPCLWCISVLGSWYVPCEGEPVADLAGDC